MVRRALVLAALLLAAPPAGAAAQVEEWDGSNPFVCELQQAGFEATGDDPDADPYCVEFDKSRQNVTELGIVDFLSKEPGRVAAALPKCFYFQADHWRGSVAQDDPRTSLWEWRGRYFFDKARGEGGMYVEGLAIAGLPLGSSGGRLRWTEGFPVPTDPRCAARAERDPEAIYRGEPGESERRFERGPEGTPRRRGPQHGSRPGAGAPRGQAAPARSLR